MRFTSVPAVSGAGEWYTFLSPFFSFSDSHGQPGRLIPGSQVMTLLRPCMFLLLARIILHTHGPGNLFVMTDGWGQCTGMNERGSLFWRKATGRMGYRAIGASLDWIGLCFSLHHDCVFRHCCCFLASSVH